MLNSSLAQPAASSRRTTPADRDLKISRSACHRRGRCPGSRESTRGWMSPRTSRCPCGSVCERLLRAARRARREECPPVQERSPVLLLSSSSRTFSSRISFGQSQTVRAIVSSGASEICRSIFFAFIRPSGPYGDLWRAVSIRWDLTRGTEGGVVNRPRCQTLEAGLALKSEFFHPFTAGEIAGVAQNSRRERRRRVLNTRSQSFGSPKLPAHPFAPVLAREDGDSGGFRRRRHRASAGCARSVGEGLRLRLRRRPRAPRRGPRERLRSRQARDPRLRDPPGEHPHDAASAARRRPGPRRPGPPPAGVGCAACGWVLHSSPFLARCAVSVFSARPRASGASCRGRP